MGSERFIKEEILWARLPIEQKEDTNFIRGNLMNQTSSRAELEINFYQGNLMDPDLQ